MSTGSPAISETRRADSVPRKQRLVRWLGVLVGGVIVLLVVSTSFTSYRVAKEHLASDLTIVERFGDLRFQFPLAFTAEIRSESGSARYRILVVGSKEWGTIGVSLKRCAGTWHVVKVN